MMLIPQCIRVAGSNATCKRRHNQHRGTVRPRLLNTAIISGTPSRPWSNLGNGKINSPDLVRETFTDDSGISPATS